MKKIIFALVFLVGSYSYGQNYRTYDYSNGNGQNSNQNNNNQNNNNFNDSPPNPRPSFELATGIQLYNFKGNFTDVTNAYTGTVYPSLYFIYSIMVSSNIPIRKINNNFYLGLNPNISLGYGSGAFAGDLPVYLTLKYGAGSFRGCQKPFGLGVGAGAMLSGVTTTLGDNYDAIPYSTFYVAPAAMAEISFDVGYGNIYQIRTDFTPVPVSKLTANYQGNISQICIRIMRIF